MAYKCGLLATYKSWDDPPRRGFSRRKFTLEVHGTKGNQFPCSMVHLWVHRCGIFPANGTQKFTPQKFNQGEICQVYCLLPWLWIKMQLVHVYNLFYMYIYPFMNRLYIQFILVFKHVHTYVYIYNICTCYMLLFGHVCKAPGQQNPMSEPSSEGWPSRIIQRLWSQRHSVDGFCWCVLVGWVGWFGVARWWICKYMNNYLWYIYIHICIVYNGYVSFIVYAYICM